MPPALLADVGIQPPSMISGSGSAVRPGADEREGVGLIAKTKAVAATAIPSGRGQQQRTAKDKQSLDYVIRSGIAGGLAGCTAKTVVGPLDRVKILFQASSPQFAKYSGSWFGLVTALREINRSEGTKGLFRGHSATLVRVFPYAAIKFLAYEQFRAIIIPSKEYETPLRRLASGSLAGLTGTFFTYPLEMIRVRLAFETKKDSKSSFSRICRQIYHEHPIRPSSGTGNLAAIPSSSPVSALAKVAAEGNVGAGAAIVAQTASQAADAVTPRAGLANFYRGFVPTMLGILPYAGISFLTHDIMGDLLRHPTVTRWTAVPGKQDQAGRVRLTHSAELVSGAVASMVGQTSAYPLEIIRRRMQVGGAIGDGRRLRIAETAAKIWAERGWRGFFVGLGIGYTKVVPMGAVGFWTYEVFKQWLGA